MASGNFAVSGKSTTGAILPLHEPDCLNWSYCKDNMLGSTYRPCHMTENPNLKP